MASQEGPEASRSKIIIDTDPGIDDILAMLLAFSASANELEVLLVSVTFGNIDVQNALRNAVSLFHIMRKEIEWRAQRNLPLGFSAARAFKPVLAAGATAPLAGVTIQADFYHGVDGLGGIHASHAHLTPEETWRSMFDLEANLSKPPKPVEAKDIADETAISTLFSPSTSPAHREILRVLRDNPDQTVSIVAVGPLTNVALAAAEDPETFLRVKEVIVMGGTVDEPGNITPLAEFNTHSDPYAAARVFALTSLDPSSTLPPVQKDIASDHAVYKPYPRLSRRLNLTLFPLDITTHHTISATNFSSFVKPLLDRGSPLAEWMSAFMHPTLAKPENRRAQAMSLHDPLALYYAFPRSAWRADASMIGKKLESEPVWIIEKDEDIRVETTGQWSRGACIVDRRGRRKVAEAEDMTPGDYGAWLSMGKGNRIDRVKEFPVLRQSDLGDIILRRVFGSSS